MSPKETGNLPSSVLARLLNLAKQTGDNYQVLLKEFDQKLADLKVRAEKMKEEAKGEINREIEEFRKNHQDAAKKLEELKAASGKAWEDLKSGTDAALEEMEKTLEKAFSRFR